MYTTDNVQHSFCLKLYVIHSILGTGYYTGSLSTKEAHRLDKIEQYLDK
jgi:hypothetical protein